MDHIDECSSPSTYPALLTNLRTRQWPGRQGKWLWEFVLILPDETALPFQETTEANLNDWRPGTWVRALASAHHALGNSSDLKASPNEIFPVAPGLGHELPPREFFARINAVYPVGPLRSLVGGLCLVEIRHQTNLIDDSMFSPWPHLRGGPRSYVPKMYLSLLPPTRAIYDLDWQRLRQEALEQEIVWTREQYMEWLSPRGRLRWLTEELINRPVQNLTPELMDRWHTESEQRMAPWRRMGYAEWLPVIRERLVAINARSSDEPDRFGLAYLVEDFAWLAAKQGRAERATTLWGAAASVRRELQAQRSEVEAIEQEQALRTLRGALGEETCARAWAAGQILALEEAIALAVTANSG